MPPAAAMEMVMAIEAFNEDRVAYPWNVHVFAVHTQADDTPVEEALGKGHGYHLDGWYWRPLLE